MQKRLLCALGAAAIMATAVPTAFAANIPQISISQSTSESTIAPCADVIVYKYRIYNGKQQYRRWNETRGYWVDPYWIDL
ncbi:MAG: hypothetical protein ACLTWR_13895 [Agathobaculum desmolans]|uniref:hypothetical protein n=1 Tax=Agathobaculum desmolans TaxID=39484 RepID=UPI00399405FA